MQYGMNTHKINEHASVCMNMYDQRTRQYGMNMYDQRTRQCAYEYESTNTPVWYEYV